MFQLDVKIERKIQFKKITEKLYAFKDTVKSTPNVAGVNSSLQGFTDEIIENYDLKTKLNVFEKYLLVSDELLEYHRKYGFPFNYDEFSGFVKKHSTVNVYTHFEKFKNIVKASTYDHEIYDLEGVPYPKAIHFDYMPSGGYITNKYYDLEKVKETLLKRDDILFSNDFPWTKPYRKIDNLIQGIPHYNAEKNDTHFIRFIWQPTREQYLKVKKKDPFATYAAIKKLDLLGIEQFTSKGG